MHMVVDSGYITCTSCGSVQGQELDESNFSYHDSPTHALAPSYTRMKRFRTKILGGLQRRLYHKLDQQVYSMLKERFEHIVPPETFLDHLLSLETGRRKPYVHVAYYYEAMFNITLPFIPEHEERLINVMFREIFFASDRLNLPGPTFPMCSLLRLIVDHFEFSLETQTVVRFAKRLRCQRRRRRYKEMFLKCCDYIYKHERTTGAIQGLKRRRGAEVATSALDEAASYTIPEGIPICSGSREGAEERHVRYQQDHDNPQWPTVLLVHDLM